VGRSTGAYENEAVSLMYQQLGKSFLVLGECEKSDAAFASATQLDPTLVNTETCSP
jgi:hypothetical protein